MKEPVFEEVYPGHWVNRRDRMTVSDLISLLKDLDPAATVFLPNSDAGDYLSMSEADITTRYLQPSEWSDEIFVKSSENYPTARKAICIG